MRVTFWAKILGLAVLTAVLSLLSNLSDQGLSETVRATKFFFSKLLNSGALWAAIAVVVGYWCKDLKRAMLLGPLTQLASLAIHYALGQAFGVFPASIWRENLEWFIAAAVFGPILGIIGTFTHRPGRLGLAASLLVPLGAMVEPLVRNYFSMSSRFSSATRIASAASGIVEIAIGLALAAYVLLRRRT